jgi:hypothetical protein
MQQARQKTGMTVRKAEDAEVKAMYSVHDSAGCVSKKEGERRCHLLLNKRWYLFPHFLSNEPATENFVLIERGACVLL